MTVDGRLRLTRATVLPVAVKHTMAAAPSVAATSQAARATASWVVCCGGRCASIRRWYSALASVLRAMRSIMRTASSGYLPAAVSAESMIASVPSKMAFATSLASARVGRGFKIMLSSICVAVMTGLPASWHFPIRRF